MPFTLPRQDRPDITVMVDWALKINYLSIYPARGSNPRFSDFNSDALTTELRRPPELGEGVTAQTGVQTHNHKFWSQVSGPFVPRKKKKSG